MSKQEQKKGIFGTVANLFKSKKEDCCSVSFEEIEDNPEFEQKLTEKQTEANKPQQERTQKGGCCG